LVQQETTLRGSGGRGLFQVFLALEGVGERISMQELVHDKRYRNGRVSQLVILGVLVLGTFVLGEARGVKSLAVELGMTTTTTWRYPKTSEELGVLEERKDRRYQIARRWIGHLDKRVRARRRG
jgi:hypothetical protein